ncbi:glycoside hydrolase family 2 TIM barrel-domain containing protein [Lacimicrobium alkaliphilum]|uniref:Glycoside hydrolase family 2 catalytic domain-containing protein n=1 Tax=Lacimicrobium alkaliphilum TaxID=1526571 RepID=A0ABQ1RIP7_9ALTE|nr:glycoside hydrolase family 2 TIM barrel-domain containing protein [Lacimicrobium alkaliphilum]GGD69523.1 hypothetical protein GCM10011357_25720 [Lacimicrobium alkaliphilum]
MPFLRSSQLMLSFLFVVSLGACTIAPGNESKRNSSAIPVKLVEREGHWFIERQGQPYFIKGAGGREHLTELAQSGGNSLRTWSADNASAILDQAYQAGLTVMLGLSMGKERHGFDYNDTAAVAEQKKRIRETVLKFKDHPALLAWGIGNELDLFYTNTGVWFAVEDIAAMIKRLDPHHLVTTVVAGVDKEKADLIASRVPSIDYLSINIYGGLENLPATLDEIGYNGAYVVTEWGPTGHWEIDKTDWGVPIEQTSTEKAAIYRHRYQQGIAAAPDKALGSYAFLWGQKQETTPTWYGVFNESGQPTEVVDSLEYLWTGEWPATRAPSIVSFTLEGQKATDSVHLKPGGIVDVSVNFKPGSDSPVSLYWEVLPESTDIKSGGDPEERPQPASLDVVTDNQHGSMQFLAPQIAGPYRLFVTIENGSGKVANANVPFMVAKN